MTEPIVVSIWPIVRESAPVFLSVDTNGTSSVGAPRNMVAFHFYAYPRPPRLRAVMAYNPLMPSAKRLIQRSWLLRIAPIVSRPWLAYCFFRLVAVTYFTDPSTPSVLC